MLHSHIAQITSAGSGGGKPPVKTDFFDPVAEKKAHDQMAKFMDRDTDQVEEINYQIALLFAEKGTVGTLADFSCKKSEQEEGKQDPAVDQEEIVQHILYYLSAGILSGKFSMLWKTADRRYFNMN